jgi:prophage regulatory protein
MVDRNLRFREVCNMTGLSRTTLWRLERDGQFPRRRRLSARCVAWLESEVEAWVASRMPLSSPAGE